MTTASTRTLTESERLDWLRLIRTENVGPMTFFRLLDQCGSATQALRALPELARRGGRIKPLKSPSRAAADREQTALATLGGRFLAACEPDYPAALRTLEDRPPILAVLGHVHLLQRAALAVVGARNASLNGRLIAAEIAAAVGRAGYTVVSGMARGIDTAAHEGALATGTVAVMAGGVDVIYPEENGALYHRMVEAGTVVAEPALGTQPQARHFPRRNRIISGLCLGVLVVEAAPRSGSLITARLAGEQGREVFAVPGSPRDPRCRGSNGLIRDGATLTETADDVLQVLDGLRTRPLAEIVPTDFAPTAPPQPDDAELQRARQAILESLGPAPTIIDELIRDCQLSPSVVTTVLLELELAGRLERHPGGRVSLI